MGSGSVKPRVPAINNKSEEANVFNFGESRVQEYLSSLSSSASSDMNENPSVCILTPPPKKRKYIPSECEVKSDIVEILSSDENSAGPNSHLISQDTKKMKCSNIDLCRLSQTEFGRDLEVGSYEQVSDRLPSLCVSVDAEDGIRLEPVSEQSGPLTRSKKRKLESDNCESLKKKSRGEGKKSRRHHRHHHRSKHHKHRPGKREKHCDTITVE